MDSRDRCYLTARNTRTNNLFAIIQIRSIKIALHLVGQMHSRSMSSPVHLKENVNTYSTVQLTDMLMRQPNIDFFFSPIIINLLNTIELIDYKIDQKT